VDSGFTLNLTTLKHAKVLATQPILLRFIMSIAEEKCRDLPEFGKAMKSMQLKELSCGGDDSGSQSEKRTD
jgi:hypothetical protein